MKLHIDRLELDLHGDIGAATAHDAARLLGPALADALRSAVPAMEGGAALTVGAGLDATGLARELARHLAPQLASAIAGAGAARPAPDPRET